MLAKKIVPGLYLIPAGVANTFLFESPGGDALVDAGYGASVPGILQAISELGKRPQDIRHILITHAHPDHIGGLAALKRATGAEAYIHPLDAPITLQGSGFRDLKPAPGLMTGIMFRRFIKPGTVVEGSQVEHMLEDGQELPIAGGLRAVHVPGHCAGQLAYFWPQHGGVMIAADTCSNLPRLGWSLGYEDLQEGRRSILKMARFDFQVACFGHGSAITHGAAERIRRKWAQ